MTNIVAITGAAGALGSTLAKTLAGAGYRVALLDVEPARARIEELASELGGFAYAGDFGAAATWDAALAGIKAKLGALPTHGALIAGGWAGGAPLHEAKDDAAYDQMKTQNLDTAYRALRALLPGMVEKKAGSIVVVGSRAVERPWTSGGAAAYGATKAAVVALAEITAKEVLSHGVRVNAILPSTMDTHANRKAMPDADPSTWVSLESASGVIAFLLSDAARDVSGAAIPVYGRA